MLLLVGSVSVDLYGFVDIFFVMFRLAGSQLTWEGGDHIVATELFIRVYLENLSVCLYACFPFCFEGVARAG